MGTVRNIARMTALAGLIGVVATQAAAQNFRLIDPASNGSKAPHEWAPFSHWDLREFPSCRVPWSVGTGPVPELDGNGIPNEPTDRAVFITLCQAGFDRWDAVVPNELGFVVTAGAGQPAGGFIQDGWNLMSWSATDLPIAVNAATLVWRSASSGVISEADIIFNSNFADDPGYGVRTWVFKANGASCAQDFDLAPLGNWPTPADGDTDEDGDGKQEGEVDMLTTAIHEIGHFLGLEHIDPLGGTHNDPANAIMEQFWTVNTGPTGGGWANQTLKLQDRDGMNFLYCPDLGDAPDPWMGVFNLYPTLVHGNTPGRVLNALQLDAIGKGAEHILAVKPRNPGRNWTYEWLARFPTPGVDSECEANVVDKDPLDDGVTWYPNPPIWKRYMRVKAWVKYASDNVGNSHFYPARPLFVNGWMDLDQDCVFDHFMYQALAPSPPVGNNVVQETSAEGGVLLPQFVDPSLPVWLRVRLDHGENVSPVIDPTLQNDEGAAQFGEVEDYPFYCTTRYEVQFLCNPLPVPVLGTVMVFVGPPEPSDAMVSHVVDAGDCIVATNAPPITTYAVTADESIVDFPGITIIPPFGYLRTGKCRPNSPPSLPQTALRSHFVTEGVPATTPVELVPADHQIPAVNCQKEPGRLEFPNLVFITVGAVDGLNGGWIDGPDPETGEWEDTLRVSVSYRVSPTLIPIEGLSPCDPSYALLPATFVGTGNVTPEDAFRFTLETPTDVPNGHYVILEVTSTWSTNAVVNRQIIEFDAPVGTPTDVETPVVPRALAIENYPNPFNPATTIRFALPAAGPVTLAVYDVGGRLVRSLVNARGYPAGVHEFEWDGRDGRGGEVASGIYFFRITAGQQTLARKAVLLK